MKKGKEIGLKALARLGDRWEEEGGNKENRRLLMGMTGDEVSRMACGQREGTSWLFNSWRIVPCRGLTLYRIPNRLIVERLKLLSQAKSTTLMARFGIGDRVCFQSPDGRDLHGAVTRLNKKTVSVDTDEGHRWNVAPGFLRLVKAAGEDVRF